MLVCFSHLVLDFRFGTSLKYPQRKTRKNEDHMRDVEPSQPKVELDFLQALKLLPLPLQSTAKRRLGRAFLRISHTYLLLFSLQLLFKLFL